VGARVSRPIIFPPTVRAARATTKSRVRFLVFDFNKMNWISLLWIALGGAAGSVIRALVGMALHSRFPWATLLVNTVGSFMIGWLMTRLGGIEPLGMSRWHALLVVGFCGGFTTFSTFSWQTLELMQRGEWSAAIGNVVLSVSLCLAGVWFGFRLARA